MCAADRASCCVHRRRRDRRPRDRLRVLLRQLRDQDDGRPALDVPPVDAVDPRRVLCGAARRAHRRRQHRHRGTAADGGAFTGFYTAADGGRSGSGVLAAVCSSSLLLGVFLGRCVVTWKIDQIIAGTVYQHLRRRPHVVPVRRGQAEPRWPRRDQDPGVGSSPTVRRDVLQQHADRLPRRRPGVRALRRAVPHPLGPAHPLGRRAPERRRHRRGSPSAATAT